MDVVEHAEMVEKELDAFVERRAGREPGPDEMEASYMESVRRFHARQRDERLWERLRFYERMLEAHTRTFQQILDRHKAGRARCKEMLGIQTERKETA